MHFHAFALIGALFVVHFAKSALAIGRPWSRGLLPTGTNSSFACAEAIAGNLTNANATWFIASGITTIPQRDQLLQIVDAVLSGDQRCSVLARGNRSESASLTWMQYPSWLNGAFTEWMWNLKTDPATAAYFSHVLFEGAQQLPASPDTDLAVMRGFSASPSNGAMIHSADLSGFSTSYTVEQKGVSEYQENACLDKASPRGPLHPRTFLLLFHRPDVLAALHGAGLTATASPPDDWDGLLQLLEAHAAAVQAANGSSVATAAAAVGSGGGVTALPKYGICVTTHTTCGRLGDLLAAMAASVEQSEGTQQGYVFDLLAAPPSAAPLVNGTAWRHAAAVLWRLLQYNAPEYDSSDGGAAAAQPCHSLSPWFLSGDCMVTFEWDFAFMGMAVPVLQRAGALGVAPLPGSRVVREPTSEKGSGGGGGAGGGALVLCSSDPGVCAVSANHDLLYLTSAGQQKGVLAAARAAGAQCGLGEVARMEAAAVAAATGAAKTAINRAPYSALFDYYVYINYERFAIGLGQDISVIQLNMASRMATHRQMQQDAMAAIRQAGGNSSSRGSSSDYSWDSATFAATPWWGSLGDEGLPAGAMAPYLERGLEAGATGQYLRALWHGVHSPNLAPDIASPVMVNWYKWALSHAALSLLQPQTSSTEVATALLVRVFDMVNEAHTPGLVRTSYEMSTGAAKWQAHDDDEEVTQGRQLGLSTGQLAALVTSVALGLLLAVLLVALLLRRLRGRHRDLLGRVLAPRTGQDTTLLISDIQNSTALWEQLPVTVMDAAVMLHHSTFRRLLTDYNGYESATEGDSFILAFADPVDAVAFAAACQLTLMLQEWPQELLEHQDGVPVVVDPQDGETGQQAGLPGSDGLRPGGRLNPSQGSFLATLAAPAAFISSRVRVAATVLRGPGGGAAGGPQPPNPGTLRGGSMFDMSSYDMSIHSGAFFNGMRGRSVEIMTRPALPAVRGPGGGGEGGGGEGGGGEGASASEVLSTKNVVFRSEPSLSPIGHRGQPGWNAGAGGGFCSPVRNDVGTKLFAARGDRPLSNGDMTVIGGVAGVGPAASSRPPALSSPCVLGPNSVWAAALHAAFPVVPPQDVPTTLTMGGQLLKSPWVMLPSGRLALLAYRGLRVRMGLHTGLDDPQHIAFNRVGSAYKYHGPFADAARCVTEAAPGGMVVLSSHAFARLRNRITAPGSASRRRNPEVLVLYAGHHVTNTALPSIKPMPALAAAPPVAVAVAEATEADTDTEEGDTVAALPRAASDLTPRLTSKLTSRLTSTPPLASTLTPRLAALLTPAVPEPVPRAASTLTSTLTPRVASTLTPRLASTLTPRLASTLTPRVASTLTPRVASTLTPRVASMLTPRVASPPLTPRRESTPPSTPKLTRPLAAQPHTVKFNVAVPFSGGGFGSGGRSMGRSTMEGTALYQAVPSALACRLVLSPPLTYSQTVQLGSLEAPTGCISVAFMYVVGASTLLADLPGPAARALDQFQHLVCRLLGDQGGYLVEGGDGLVLAAFGCPTGAVEWALDCVAGLKKLDWEDELLSHWLCEEVLSVGLAGGGDPMGSLDTSGHDGNGSDSDPLAGPGGRSFRRGLSRMPSMARLGAMAATRRVLERGLRIKVGLDTGPASHLLNEASGRLSYRGKVMNRASRVAGKAAAGQVVCTDACWRGVLEGPQSTGGGVDGLLAGYDEACSDSDSGSGLVGVSLGRVALRGVSNPVELIQCMKAD